MKGEEVGFLDQCDLPLIIARGAKTEASTEASLHFTTIGG